MAGPTRSQVLTEIHHGRRPNIPYEFRTDRALILEAVKKDGTALHQASNELRGDAGIVSAAVTQAGYVLEQASEELRNNHDIVLAAVKQDGHALQFASERLKNDNRIVLAAVKQAGRALQYASEALYADPLIVRAAVEQNWQALQVIPPCNDSVAVLAAVQQSESALQYASDELKGDREIVTAALSRGWKALQFASNELKKDPEIVMSAVEQCWHALQFASDEARAEQEIVMAAVGQSWQALRFASMKSRDDQEIMMAAVGQSWQALQFASNELKRNTKIVMAAVEQSGQALQHASPELRNNRDVVLAAVGRDGDVLKYASKDLQGDKDVVLCALRQNPKLSFVPDGMRNQPEIKDYLKKVTAIAEKDGRQKESENWRFVAQTLFILNIANLGLGLEADDDADEEVQVVLIVTAVIALCTSLVFIIGRMLYENLLELGSDHKKVRNVELIPATAPVLSWSPRWLVPVALVLTEAAMVMRGALSVRKFDDEQLQHRLVYITVVLVIILNAIIWRCYVLFKRAKAVLRGERPQNNENKSRWCVRGAGMTLLDKVRGLCARSDTDAAIQPSISALDDHTGGHTGAQNNLTAFGTDKGLENSIDQTYHDWTVVDGRSGVPEDSAVGQVDGPPAPRGGAGVLDGRTEDGDKKTALGAHNSCNPKSRRRTSIV